MAVSLESCAAMTTRAPIHLRPTTELAERVLLPGDPGRALALAQMLLEKPLMFNHHRGLWGYTGRAADGEQLTIQSTGMGGPSAAIVLQELIALGVRRAVRVGTCGALDGGLRLGDVLVAREALAADGTSRALGAGDRVAADEDLTAALERASSPGAASATSPGTASPVAGATVVSTDLFYEHDCERERAWRAAGAIAVEMEAATLFALGARAGVPVGCVLAVSDVIPTGARASGDGHAPTDAPTGEGRARIDDDTLLATAETMGRVALSALAA
jgi:DeoD family purine-nucleoside phosphorylase